MAQFIAGQGSIPRPCGCLGQGRHKNSCPGKASVLDAGATLPPMEIAPSLSGPARADGPPPQVGGMAGLPIPASLNDKFVQQEAAPVAVPPVTPPPVELFCGLPVMPDEWLEQYGGDLAALESYSTKSGRPMATRQSTIAASRAQPDLNYKGMLVYRHAPEKLFHFVYLLEDGSSNYQQAIGTLRQRGCKPVTVADFYVHSTLRDGVFISEDGTANGRLTLGGALKGGMTVIYRQDERSYNEWRSYDRRFSDQIQLTAEEQAARLQGQLASDGFSGVIARATIE